MDLTNLEEKISSFEQSTSSLKGRLDLIEEQFVSTEQKLTELNDLDILNKKAIELLNLVQKSTKELICNMFETICTHALQYAYDNDGYSFELEMTNKRNKPSVRFLVKTPEKQQPHDICSTTAGGERDVLALALRFVLLEVSGNQGLLFLDEPFKRLDDPEIIARMIDFMKETQKDTKRQIITIAHEQELVDACENPIILKK